MSTGMEELMAVVSILTVSVLFADLISSWTVIKNFFRYRLWREGMVEVVNHNFSRDVVAVRVGAGLHLTKGTFADSFDYLYADREELHIPAPWYISPISSLCLLIMRRVYYRQIDEAQQLIDL